MKRLFILISALALSACSSSQDIDGQGVDKQNPDARNLNTQVNINAQGALAQSQPSGNSPVKLKNSMSLAHKELLSIIDDQNWLFETYQGEVTDRLEIAQMNTKYKKIVSRWQNYISQYPNDIDAIIIYGKFLRAVGEFTNSYAAFLEVDKIDGNIPVVKQQLATFQGDFGMYKESLANMKKAIELKPDEAIYHYQLAELLCAFYNEYLQEEIYETQALNEAISDSFEKSIALAPKNSHFCWRYAQSFYQQSDANWQKALKAWENLESFVYMKLDKNNVLLNKARVLIELYRDDEAMQLLEAIDTAALAQDKNRLINIIKAGEDGDVQKEKSLKLQEKEALDLEIKEEISKSPSQ